MKKTLLLSVVASTMIMAGGDIAPVEPVVAAPVEAAAWNFEGQAVLYYQTADQWGNGDLFDQGGGTNAANDGWAAANAGISLKASNADLFYGIGAGVKVIGLGTLGLDEDVVSNTIQNGERGELNSGAVTEAYLTYTADSIKSTWKIGRQTLPKSLSPFAFSENWAVFQNTFEAGLMVNSYFEDTTIVVAHVTGSNSHAALGDFNNITDDGVTMLTLQNKSFEGVTLTGTGYFGDDFTGNGDDATMLWADAQFALGMFNIGLQGGNVDVDATGFSDTSAFGAKVGTKLSMFDLSLAYSTVDDGDANIHNYGTGVKTPLYTQLVANQNSIKRDSDTFVFRAGMDALGGKFGLAYNYSDLGDTALLPTFGTVAGTSIPLEAADTYQEVDLTYKTKVFNDTTTLFAAYVYQDDDRMVDSQNFMRFWARYNF